MFELVLNSHRFADFNSRMMTSVIFLLIRLLFERLWWGIPTFDYCVRPIWLIQ